MDGIEEVLDAGNLPKKLFLCQAASQSILQRVQHNLSSWRGAGQVSEVAGLPSSLLILTEPRSAFCRIWLPISVWRMDRSLSWNSLSQVHMKLYERQRGEQTGLCTVSGLLGSSITQGLAFPLAFAIGTCQTSNHICVCVEIPPSKERQRLFYPFYLQGT